MRLGAVTFLLLLSACAGGQAQVRRDDAFELVVIAPHPDDEVLLAAGAMKRALAEQRRVAVIIMTNGDYTCERDGSLRERESLAALTSMGVAPSNVYFMGYPDGALAKLGAEPLPPQEHRDPSGQCIAQTHTWTDASTGRLDVHRLRTGNSSEWTSFGLTEDLAALLGRLDPLEVYLPHAIDDHPDHAMTYVYFRRALDRLGRAPAVVHRGVVHAGPCWPAEQCGQYYLPTHGIPPLPNELSGYAPTTRIAIAPDQKLELISRYVSQAGVEPRSDWLSSFARTEEVYFDERYRREGSRWVRLGARRSGGEWVSSAKGYEEWERWRDGQFEAAGVRPIQPMASGRRSSAASN